MKNPVFGALCASALALAAAPALAHATLEQSEAPAGAAYRAVIRIGHGCDGQATQTLRVQLPEGFYNAKPMPKAGWTLETVKGPYAQPFDNHGTPMTEGTREVVWSGGDLQDDWYDEFVIRGTVGADVTPGTVLYFSTVQECADGKEEWIDVTGSKEAQNPAPVAGGFLTVANAGADDRLVAARVDFAGRAEIHEMAMEGDVMKMRQLSDGLAIPAGATVELKPGGYHLMFMDLKQPLVEGETVKVTLQFEKAGEVEVPMTVGPMNAGKRGGKDGGHGGH